MSVTPNQLPLVPVCPPQSRYKSLIIHSKNKKNPYIYTAICRCYNFHVNQLHL
ncbi:unnamed protein product, partial [Staurois parvus]